MHDPRMELERLFEVEYGEPVELALRLFGVSGGSVLLFVYTSWVSALWWGALFLFSHAVHFAFLRLRMARATPTDPTVAGVLYLGIVVAFSWMPGVMAGNEDPVLSFVGTVLNAILIAFLIRRADRPRWLVLALIGLIAVFWAGVFALKVEQLETMVQKAGILIVSVAAFLYLAQAMIIARKTRLEAEDAAERAAQDQKLSAIGRLAGGVAHDFNNALTVIKGNLELHQELTDPDERAHVLSEALAATDRAGAVVHDLLVYARKAPIRNQVLDCNTVLQKIADMVAPNLPAHVALSCHRASTPHHILADEGLLSAAMIHLVRNAEDALDGQGRIEISSACVTLRDTLQLTDKGYLPPGEYICVEVSDTGSGISPEHLRQVLDPFYTTKAIGQGTGLGLSVVSGFMREARGGLTIDSSGAGTSVRLYLPRVPAPAMSPTVIPACPKTQNAAPEDGVLSFD